jgi:hypothetical protein
MSEGAPIRCCVLLRDKTMYFDPDERPGLLKVSQEQTYWCSRTQRPEGPDKLDAHPAACQAGRACYEAEE